MTVCKAAGHVTTPQPTTTRAPPARQRRRRCPPSRPRRRRRTSAKARTSAAAGGGNPYPIDEDGDLRGPFAAGDIPNIQTASHAGRENEGQTVLTNGQNVGGRAGTPEAPGALGLPRRLDANVQPGRACGCSSLNASTIRYIRLRLTDADRRPGAADRVGGEGGLLNNAVDEGGTQGTWNTEFTAGRDPAAARQPGRRRRRDPERADDRVLTLWTEDYQRTGAGYVEHPDRPGHAPQPLRADASAPPFKIEKGDPLRLATGRPVEQLGAATGVLLNPADLHAERKAWPAQNDQPDRERRRPSSASTTSSAPTTSRGRLHRREHLGSTPLRARRATPCSWKSRTKPAPTIPSTCTASRSSR